MGMLSGSGVEIHPEDSRFREKGCNLLLKLLGAAAPGSDRIVPALPAMPGLALGIPAVMTAQLFFHFMKGQANRTIGRSEEHTSELQSRGHLVCRLLLEKKKNIKTL